MSKQAEERMGAAESYLVTCASCGAANRVPLQRVRAGAKVVCGRCKTPLPPATPVEITDQNFATEVAASPLPVLLDLWAPWCGPCRQIGPIVEQLAGELAGRIRVGKLNVDQNPGTAARFGVQSIPTLLVLSGGREIDRIVGAVPKQEIERRLQAVL